MKAKYVIKVYPPLLHFHCESAPQHLVKLLLLSLLCEEGFGDSWPSRVVLWPITFSTIWHVYLKQTPWVKGQSRHVEGQLCHKSNKEWVTLHNIALRILSSCWAEQGKVSHMAKNKINSYLPMQPGWRVKCKMPKFKIWVQLPFPFLRELLLMLYWAHY